MTYEKDEMVHFFSFDHRTQTKNGVQKSTRIARPPVKAKFIEYNGEEHCFLWLPLPTGLTRKRVNLRQVSKIEEQT